MVGAGLATWEATDTVSAAESLRLEGYADATSVAPGGKLVLFVDNGLGPRTTVNTVLTVSRTGHPEDRLVYTRPTEVRGQVTAPNPYLDGCGWKPTTWIQIPRDWQSGLYLARVDDGVNHCTIPFVVRASRPGSTSSILLQVPFTTAQAYNNWGGKSLYDTSSTDGIRAPRVSFDRPFANEFNDLWAWARPFVKYAERVGIPLEYASSIDLHDDERLLAAYQLFVTVGHDEYWSLPMRRNLDDFVRRGGNATIFSGNTCWWQVRFEPNRDRVRNRTMVCFKNWDADPVRHQELKTVNWYEFGPLYGRKLGNNPENTTIGLSCVKGGQWTSHPNRPDTPYVVHRPDHWVLAGTGLAAGSGFGQKIVGYETDTLEYVEVDGRPVPTGLDGSPANFDIIALADVRYWAQPQADGVPETGGTATFGMYNNNGTVLNVGVTDWVKDLVDPAAPVEIITTNALRRLSQRKSAEQAAAQELYQYRALGADGQLDPVERYLYSTSPFLAQQGSGWRYEGPICTVFGSKLPGSDPVYQYRTSERGKRDRIFFGKDLVTLWGWKCDGAAFWAYAGPKPPRKAPTSEPVYQLVSTGPGEQRFRYSRLSVAPPGWRVDRIAFWAPVVGLVPY